MISFKLFVEAIHHAIVSASDSLMDKMKVCWISILKSLLTGRGK